MKTSTCRHFRGLIGPGMRPDHKPCDKGHNVRSEFGPAPFKLPCLSKACDKPCGDFDGYTQEECEEDRRWVKETIERFSIVGPAIDDAHRKSGSHDGTIECPICHKGTLHWGVSQYNGHRRGSCTTDGCVGFME